MAISIRGTAGAWVAATATTQTVTLPTHATGDMLLVRVGMKHATLPGNITCATAGWRKIGQFNNGTTASGNGTGDVCVAVFWKIATSAAETNPVITYHASVAATPSCASPIVFQKASGESWITPPLGDGGAIAAATSMSATIQTHLPAKADDMLVAFLVTNDNTTLTVPTFTQTGLTLATVTEAPATALSDATSNDISADACYRLVTAGTSSAAAVVTGTNSVADVGAAWTTRLRVVTTPAGTVIYPLNTAVAEIDLSPLLDRIAWTTRGGTSTSINAPTVTGPTAPIHMGLAGIGLDWFTNPLTAFTLSGGVKVDVNAHESNALANATVRCEVARVDGDGTNATVWGATTYGPEVGTTAGSSFHSFLIDGDDLAVSNGQRLRIRFYGDDAEGLTMAATYSVRVSYQGPTPSAEGDTYLTFTQTLTEFTAGTSANAITATATAAAIGSTDAIVATLAVATTTGTANNPTARPGISTTTGVGAGTGAALDTDAKVAPTAQVAAGTGVAYNATVATAVSVTAGVAAATATVGPAAVGTSPYSTLIVQDGPAGYWRLGEASGNPQDSSGRAHHVTTVGGTPTYGVTGSLAADPNTAITLDGSSEYFSVPQDADLHGNTISIEAWFKRSGVTGITAFIWDNGYGDSELYISSGDVIFFGRAGVATLRQSAGTYTDTDWHHLVAVKDGASSREIYVDGVAVGTGGTDSTLANANGVSGIGAQQVWNNHWNGSLDEVAVYAYALTAGQVLAHYTAGVPAAATEANAEVATATGAALDADAAPGEYVNPDVAAATGTALGTTTSIAATVGAATGTAAAYDATASTASMVSATAQVATATGVAVAAAPSIAPDLDAATATGTAITATAHETQPANLQAAAGTGEALGTDAKVGATSVVAAATGAGLSPDAALKVNAGVATGTGAALVADGLPGTRALANVATATGAASVADGLPGELAPAEVAAAAGTAQNSTTKIAPTLQVATATGTANNATVSVASTGQVTGQTALATGAALGTTAKVVANLNVATGTGAAANPSVSTSLARTPGVAAGTGAALNVTAKVVVNAATAAATGTAANATVTTTAAASATAQVATAQGAAHAATVGAASTISATAGVAAGTGTAYNATIIVAVAAAAASSTGTAAAASIAVAVAAHAQTATATGTAYDAGVALGAVAALAEVAVATGIAYNARAQTAIGSGIDTEGGIHGGIVSLPAIRAGVATVPGVRGGIAAEPGVRGGIVTEPRIKGRVA